MDSRTFRLATSECLTLCYPVHQEVGFSISVAVDPFSFLPSSALSAPPAIRQEYLSQFKAFEAYGKSRLSR